MNKQAQNSRETSRPQRGHGRRNWIIAGLIIILVLIIGGLIMAKHRRQSQDKHHYDTMTVSKQADFVLTGKIQASQQQILAVPQGQVQSINVNNGDHVVAGQALLTTKQTISQDDDSDSSSDNQAGPANSDSNANSQASTTTTTVTRTLTAPYSGYLQVDNSKQGAPVLTLYSDGLQFNAEVSEYDYSKLHNGTPLHVKALATNREQTTPVSYLSVIPSKNSTSNNAKYQLRANVNGQEFMDGQTAKASVSQDGFRIPKSAVKNGYVFVMDGQRVRRVHVSGQAVNSYYLVTDGVDQGDKIITNPDHKLKNHQKVKQDD